MCLKHFRAGFILVTVSPNIKILTVQEVQSKYTHVLKNGSRGTNTGAELIKTLNVFKNLKIDEY